MTTGEPLRDVFTRLHRELNTINTNPNGVDVDQLSSIIRGLNDANTRLISDLGLPPPAPMRVAQVTQPPPQPLSSPPTPPQQLPQSLHPSQAPQPLALPSRQNGTVQPRKESMISNWRRGFNEKMEPTRAAARAQIQAKADARSTRIQSTGMNGVMGALGSALNAFATMP